MYTYVVMWQFNSGWALHTTQNNIEVTSFSVAVAVEKQRRFFVDNLMLGVQLADVSTRCSSHPQGKSEARCENAGYL